jgi:hypothetical protein
MRAFILETTATAPFLERIIRLKQQFWNYSAVSQRRWFAEHVREYDLHVIGHEAGRVAQSGNTVVGRFVQLPSEISNFYKM